MLTEGKMRLQQSHWDTSSVFLPSSFVTIPPLFRETQRGGFYTQTTAWNDYSKQSLFLCSDYCFKTAWKCLPSDPLKDYHAGFIVVCKHIIRRCSKCETVLIPEFHSQVIEYQHLVFAKHPKCRKLNNQQSFSGNVQRVLLWSEALRRRVRCWLADSVSTYLEFVRSHLKGACSTVQSFLIMTHAVYFTPEESK